MEEARSAGREAAFDLAVVVSLLALSAALVLGVVDGAGDRLRAAVVVVAHVAPLVVRRRAPVPVAGAMTAAAVLSVPLGVPMVVLGPATAVLAFTLGERLPDALGRGVLVVVLVAMAGVVAANGGDLGTVISNAVVLGIAWWLGRRSRTAEEQVQAERATATAAAERAVVEERLRIARELHDIVAHAMSVIAVQAGTGRYVIDRSPEVAAAALATIEEVSRSALEELRRLLAVLREEGSGPATLSPTPGLDDLPALVTASGAAGVTVELTVVGTPVPVPPGIGLCAYRIVQEALTNVRKHARTDRASVVVAYDPAGLEIDVADEGIGGPGPTGTSPGHGLVGMRERAELYGGTVDVDRDSGYRIRVRLPLEAGPR